MKAEVALNRGFVVSTPVGLCGLLVGQGLPKLGVLMVGDQVALFKTPRSAAAAIRRTVAYASRHWPSVPEYRTLRLVEPDKR